MRTLVLVPTELERRVLEPILAAAPAAPGTRCWEVELCGFGPVAAAARTARLVGRHAPDRVLLAGIAGRLDDRLALGAAYRFAEVACHGVGVGAGDGFVPAAALAWPQWPGDAADGSPAIGDTIPCATDGPAEPQAELLLTACAASANADDVRTRRRLFPAATAEDMEGFAVALACRLCGVPCDIVRGISNTAGDRDSARWQTTVALRAAGELALRIMAGRA